MHDDIYLTSAPGMIPEDCFEELVWYSYLTDNKSKLHTKRYTCWVSYQEACESDLVDYVSRLYTAKNRDAAVAKGVRIVRSKVCQ